MKESIQNLQHFPLFINYFLIFDNFDFSFWDQLIRRKTFYRFPEQVAVGDFWLMLWKWYVEISLHSFINSQTVLSLGHLFQSFDLIALEFFLHIKGWVLPQACFCWRENLKFYQLVFYKFLKAGFDNWRTSRTYVRLLSLVYAWLRTCVSWHVRSFFPYDISKFSRFFWLFFSGSGSLKT